MTRPLAALTLVLISVGTILGASVEFGFFNDFTLYILLSILLAGLLALGGVVMASFLMAQKSRPQPVRIRILEPERARRIERATGRTPRY